MISPARVAAYQASLAISSGAQPLPAALADVREDLSDDRDRALATLIATGVQRWRAALDHLIVHFSKRPLDRLDPEIVEVLRIGIFQLMHLTRVPAAAVVDDGVNLARRAGKKSAAGFVNAVLRSVSRRRRALPLPPKPAPGGSNAESLEYLSVTLSHPRWLAERWLSRFGFDVAERWMRFDNEAAPLTLRANRFRTTPARLRDRLSQHGVATHPGAFAPDALIVEHGNPLAPESNGDFVVQDEASQLVALLAGDNPGRLVLDACASPGGKATAVASLMSSDAHLVACDVRRSRIQLLRRTIAAVGAANILVVQADLLASLPFKQLFDTVIVDAPCSGLGILRSDPDIRWRRTEADLAVLSAAQLRMLHHAADVVAPGGRLVYATCSSEPEENERTVEAFLAGATGFTRIDARRSHSQLPHAVVDADGFFRTAPDPHELEAFFGAVLERSRR